MTGSRVSNFSLKDSIVTGHSHFLKNRVEIFLIKGVLYFYLVEDSELVHEEHETINIPAGYYRLREQRELLNDVIRRVLD